MSIYDRMLLVYPRAFRNRFAGDMRDTFAQAAREARHKGMVSVLRLWVLCQAATLCDDTRLEQRT